MPISSGFCLDHFGIAAHYIVATLLDELRRQLPAPEQIAKLLEGLA